MTQDNADSMLFDMAKKFIKQAGTGARAQVVVPKWMLEQLLQLATERRKGERRQEAP